MLWWDPLNPDIQLDEGQIMQDSTLWKLLTNIRVVLEYFRVILRILSQPRVCLLSFECLLAFSNMNPRGYCPDLSSIVSIGLHKHQLGNILDLYNYRSVSGRFCAYQSG